MAGFVLRTDEEGTALYLLCIHVLKNRFISSPQLLFCSNVIHGVLKRCTWPASQLQAQDGGFVLRTAEGGKPVYRNPATPQLLQLMDNVLACARFVWVREKCSELT